MFIVFCGVLFIVYLLCIIYCCWPFSEILRLSVVCLSASSSVDEQNVILLLFQSNLILAVCDMILLNARPSVTSPHLLYTISL